MRDAIRKGVVQGVVAGLIRSLGIWGLIISYALSFAAAAASKIGGLPLWLAFLVFLLGGTVLVIAFLLMAIALARLGIIARELFSTPSKRNLPVVAFQSEQATAGQRSTTTFSDETRRFYDGIREFALVSLSDASDSCSIFLGQCETSTWGHQGTRHL